MVRIIVNRDIPIEAISNLRKYGDILKFSSSGITYSAISNHPDIFIFQTNDGLIIAPNTPMKFKKELDGCEIAYTEGKTKVGDKYPHTSPYNAVVSRSYLIHNLNHTDPLIREYCSDKKSIHVNQAYTRCNLLPLNNDKFITSDKGIYNILSNNDIEVFYFNPESIILPEFTNGFFGGACGFYDNEIITIGNISDHHKDGNSLSEYLTQNSIAINELYAGPLFDGGSIFLVGN